MGIQPKHWLVEKLGGTPMEGKQGMQSTVVIAETEEGALAQGSSWLGLPPRMLKATRFTSGAPVYDPQQG